MNHRKEAFEAYRNQMNNRILATGNRETKRFFGLDSRVYDYQDIYQWLGAAFDSSRGPNDDYVSYLT